MNFWFYYGNVCCWVHLLFWIKLLCVHSNATIRGERGDLEWPSSEFRKVTLLIYTSASWISFRLVYSVDEFLSYCQFNVVSENRSPEVCIFRIGPSLCLWIILHMWVVLSTQCDYPLVQRFVGLGPKLVLTVEFYCFLVGCKS